MKIFYRAILIVFALFICGIFLWAVFAPKEDISERIQKTIKEQQKKADLSFKDVSFEEVVSGIKYWQLKAEQASVNKSTNLATLEKVKGTFFEEGDAVLRFISPAALWDMKGKEIFLDKPLGYDVALEDQRASLLKKGAGYWFRANNLRWDLGSKKLLCQGNIIINKGNVRGLGQKLKGDVALEKIVLSGKPKVTISRANTSPITIEAKTFEIISKDDTILAQGNPQILWQAATIDCQKIKYLQAEKKLELMGDVVINYKDIKASGQKASYLTEEEIIILEGNAKATQGDNQLSGDKVQVLLKDEKISVLGQGTVIISDEELK
ncbi:MAG: LPS export ABC transporter periplasmic protein LptC [Candidatus Saganbacteria bacterium]|nr:LPS export ABC transporter periplasmic protein LptC [Candidatus Saganbacteria bacterium]